MYNYYFLFVLVLAQTSTEPPVTTESPTQEPQGPKSYSYALNNNVCIRLTASLVLNITYANKSGVSIVIIIVVTLFVITLHYLFSNYRTMNFVPLSSITSQIWPNRTALVQISTRRLAYFLLSSVMKKLIPSLSHLSSTK